MARQTEATYVTCKVLARNVVFVGHSYCWWCDTNLLDIVINVVGYIESIIKIYSEYRLAHSRKMIQKYLKAYFFEALL